MSIERVCRRDEKVYSPKNCIQRNISIYCVGLLTHGHRLCALGAMDCHLTASELPGTVGMTNVLNVEKKRRTMTSIALREPTTAVSLDELHYTGPPIFPIIHHGNFP